MVLRVDIQQIGKGHFRISGVIGPDLDLTAIKTSFQDQLIFDLKEIKEVSPIGIKLWMEGIRSLMDEGKKIIYEKCSETFIIQCSFVLELTHGIHVSSFYSSFICENCNEYQKKLLQTDEIDLENLPPLVSCLSCGESMEAKEVGIFGFLENV